VKRKSAKPKQITTQKRYHKLISRQFVFSAEDIIDKTDLAQWRDFVDKRKEKEKPEPLQQTIEIPEDVERDLPF